MATTRSPPPLLRPSPRRPFNVNPLMDNPSTAYDESAAQTGGNDRLNIRTSGGEAVDDQEDSLARSHSLVNLTSSTLFGIYSDDASNRDSEPATPRDAGAETPAVRGSIDNGRPITLDLSSLSGINLRRESQPFPPSTRPKSPVLRSKENDAIRSAARLLALVVLGVSYGELISHLHDNRQISPVRLEAIDGDNWVYILLWAAARVGLGWLLPSIDALMHRWRQQAGARAGRSSPPRPKSDADKPPRPAGDWATVVRSIGAVVGIAFLIRRLPLSSPQHLSLAWALAGPILWYLLDRTPQGIALSALAGLLGVLSLLAFGPASMLRPVPENAHITSDNRTAESRWISSVQGYIAWARGGEQAGPLPASYSDAVGVMVWLASVLFCSCIFFGNVGRRLGVANSTS